MGQETKSEPKQRTSERVVGGVSKVVISLTWGILLAVVVFVVYLFSQFY